MPDLFMHQVWRAAAFCLLAVLLVACFTPAQARLATETFERSSVGAQTDQVTLSLASTDSTDSAKKTTDGLWRQLQQTHAAAFIEIGEHDARIPTFRMLLVSLMVAIALWVMVEFLARREYLVGWFVLAQCVQIFFVITLMGYLPALLPQGTNIETLVTVSFPGSLITTMLFNRLLIRLFEPSAGALRALEVLIVLSAIEILVAILGFPDDAFRLGAINLALLVPTLLWLGYSTKRDALPGRIVLRVTYNALALLLSLVVIPLFAADQSPEAYRDATILQSLFGAVGMSLFLFRRSYALGKQEIENRLEFERIEQGLEDHKAKIDEQSRFMDMLSHELKTPLSVIQITLDTMSLPQRKRDRLENAVNTMLDVIDRCRLSTQIDEQRLNVVMETFDLGELIEEVADSRLTPSRIVLDTDPVMLESDRQLLAVVLHNLVDNALKYSPQDSAIRVALSSQSERFSKGVTVMISNVFVGQQAPDPQTMFDKYVRGATSTGQSGSGLGLHLCRQLVEMLGGSLSCQVLGDEVVFVLWMPDAASLQEANQRALVPE